MLPGCPKAQTKAMSVFIGGPLDGKEDFEVPPQETNEILIPWQDLYPGHPAYKAGVSVYLFDGLAWRYKGERG